MAATSPDGRGGPDVLSVSALTARVKGLIEGEFGSVWVAGEISNVSRPSSGHVYLSLKDSKATLKSVIYRGVGMNLLGYAILQSVGKGFDGRLSLHASNSDALGFYRAVEHKLNAPLFHPERTGILGPTPQAARGDSAKTYLETTESGARAWLEGYRND